MAKTELDGVALLGAASPGVWTRRQALGVTTRGTVRSCVRRGLWEAVRPGVYVDAGQELDAWQRAHAAVLASGGEGEPSGTHAVRSRAAVASGRTAARLYGLPLIDDADPATGACEHLLDEVTVAAPADPLASRSPRRETRVLHRTAEHLAPDEVLRSCGGLWLTTPVRTLVDLAGLLTARGAGLRARRRAAPAARGRVAAGCNPGALRVVAGRRRVPDGAARSDGRAESPAETLARLALLPALPGLVPQHRSRDAPGG